MPEIRDILKEKYNIDTSVEYGIIIGDSGCIKVQITPPSGTQHPYRTTWRLRMHPSASFESWGNNPAAICEEFDNANLVAEYLSNTTAIYKVLFAYLSDSHKIAIRPKRIHWL